MKKCHLTIEVRNKAATVALERASNGITRNNKKEIDKEIDTLKIPYNRDLDNKLISGIDKILKRNRIDISLSGCFLGFGKYPLNTTSSLITKAIARGMRIRHI